MDHKVVANLKGDISVPVELDGEPQIAVLRRPHVKLNSQPEIVIALPCGNKEMGTVFKCKEELGGCGKSWLQNGTYHPHLVPFHWAASNMQMTPPMNCTLAYLVESGRLSAEARQIMTKKALRMGCKYILYWDDDTIPPPMGLYQLHAWMEMHPEAGAISGVYTTKEDPPVPLIFERHGKGVAWDVPMGPGAQPVPIFGAGAGFLLARIEAIADVIERMQADNDGKEVAIWQDTHTVAVKGGFDVNSPDHNQFSTTWGHDIRFCKLLNEHDWPVYVHGQVLCGHYDIKENKMYFMSEDAPGFKREDKNEEAEG